MNLKDLIKLFIPPIIFVIKNSFYWNNKKTVNYKLDIDALKKIYSEEINSKKCFVFGNGPSLEADLRTFENEFQNGIIFCVNSFPLTPEFKKYKPDFLVFADPDYTSESNFLLKEKEILTNKLISIVDWEIKILMPKYFEQYNWFIKVAESNNFIKLYYIQTEQCVNKNQFENYKLGIKSPNFQTVLVKSIFDALNIGFKNIFLFGVEISMHQNISVSNSGIVTIKESHFYKEEIYIKENPFWKNSEKTETFTMSEALNAFSLMHKGFEEMEQYSKYLGSKIYNCSGKTFVDAFEILDFGRHVKENN